jgi:ATP-dependent DNA helicase RecG
MAHNASTGFHNGVPRLQGIIEDATGQQIGFTLFGDQRELAKKLTQGAPVAMAGIPASYGNRTYLNKAEPVDLRWLGKLCPKYAGKPRVIGPDTVRERVLEILPSVATDAASQLLAQLGAYGEASAVLALAGAGDTSLDEIILKAHLPETEEEGRAAQDVVERLAAMNAVTAAWSNRPREGIGKAFTFDWDKVAHRVKALPHPLTEEQRRAIFEALRDMQREVPMRRILSGDVGTGKTFVYAAAVAAVADHGGRAAVLAPTQPLAAQIAGEMRASWPDLDVALVGGEDQAESYRHQVLVGTTALLHRDVGGLDFLVVDEQQKFSRQQREQLATGGTHLLEASGTCIPRSMALIRYGVLKVSKLTKPHTEKNIKSRIWMPEERGQLLESVKATVVKGGQVLVVYPLKEGDGINSAETAFEVWDKHFPGRARLIHSKIGDEQKERAIQDMKENKADVLVSTTVVEVGISIPRIRHVVVVEPDRLGLTQLHQIRGRAARNGGTGYFSMYLRRELKDATMERLQVLLETTDGFKIAERDLELRGYGSLKSDADKQTGDDELLYGRPVRLEILDQVAAGLAALTR